MGEPSSSMNCLRLVPVASAAPRTILVPRPAAGKITAHFISSVSLSSQSCKLLSSTLADRVLLTDLVFARSIVGFPAVGKRRAQSFIILAENHFASGSL